LKGGEGMKSHKLDGLDGIVLKFLFLLGEELFSWFLAVAEATRHRPFRSTEKIVDRKEVRLPHCYFGKDHFSGD